MVMKMKFIISGILIVAIGLVLSHTYRPYVYENHINDYHLADVIGSIVCVPAAVLCVYGIENRYSIKQTLSKILCKWKQDSVVSLFLYLNSVFKHKHKLIHNQAPV